MPHGIINLALGLAIQVGNPGPSEQPGFPAPARAFGQYGSEGSSEQRLPSDSQLGWLHGYHQEIPAYGGHHVFRPYNYKDVLSQSQTAAGWGERPNMPYAQQFWHKYHDQATMLKMSRTQSVPTPFVSYPQPMPQNSFPITQNQTWVAQPSGVQLPVQQLPWQPSTSGQSLMSFPDAIQPPAIQTTSDFNQLNFRK